MDTDFDFSLITKYAGDAAMGLGLLILVILGLYLIDYLFEIIKKKLFSLNLKSLNLFGLELINVGKQELIITTILQLIQLIVSVTFIYFSLVVILSQIEATKEISSQLIDLIFVPLGGFYGRFVSYLPNLFNIVITIVMARYIIKGVRLVSGGVISGNFHFPGFEPRTAKTTAGIITFIVYVLTIIVVMPSMPGYGSVAFNGIATFIGALITIGGSSVIANYVAGIVLTYMHAYDKGDWIEIDGITGKIVETGPFAIRLISYKKEDINIPNAKVLSTTIRNYSGKSKSPMVLHTEVSIGYDVHWKQVNELLVDAAKKTKLFETSQAPFVLQKKLDDFYIVYELNALLKDPSIRPKAYSILHARILDVFNEAGIEIMSPHFQAERDGSESTIIKDNESANL